MPRTATDKSAKLVVVESPAKARTISSYLGPGWIVEASLGHIRDLPSGAKQLPEKYKKEPWAYLGVNVDDGFEPIYVINPDRTKQVNRLRALLKQADELYLATDEDREGEAIAWHLVETLRPKVPVRRMVFHEITRPAIEAAVANPREINRDLVDAQEARRILDRLYGYDVSAVLWKKVQRGLSAGRVQSVATRIVVERERERMRFRPAEYWSLEATLAVDEAQLGDEDPRTFVASLVALDDERVATGRDFDPTTGAVRAGTQVVHLDGDGARGLAARLENQPFTVTRVETRPYRRRPYPPFITSTLQQEASRKLRMSSAVTMRVAQRLYENGYITYMRTDSVALSETAIAAARAQIAQLYGERFVPPQPRHYRSKVKNAQEAHEAIRPAGDTFRTPGEVAAELSPEELRLYELIWRRTIASQMTDAVGSSVSVRIRATSTAGEVCDFVATGKTITDPGFLKAYVESSDDAEAEAEDAERRLPPLAEQQVLSVEALEATEHRTQPPPRYTEASLVKALEELGIGRPSTYAQIMQTIQDRGYVFRRGQTLIPSFTAFAVVGLLERHYPRLVDYDFTASMEDQLDEIAVGELSRVDFLRAFYFGDDTGADGSVARSGGLKKMVTEKLAEIDAREVNSIPLFTDDQGREVVVRVGRYGPYLQRTRPGESGDEQEGERATVPVPDGIAPDELTPQKVEELFVGGSGERKLGDHPETGEPVVLRTGRYGPYLSYGDRNVSLLRSQSPETLTFEDALRLLSLPRLVGKDPDGNEIYAASGRYGPYLKRGDDTRSLESEEQLFTITLEEALALFAAPKTRGRRTPAAPLRELGTDPLTERQVVIRDGRFGPYITDGETNVSLRRGMSVESVTLEQASQLLMEKRASTADQGGTGRPAKKAAKKAAAKKAASTTAAKKAASTTAAKKATPAKAAKKAAAPKTSRTATQ
ncbi:MAG: type I DNA topoisomerase [Micromonosporaceae bacterium]